LIVRGAIVVFTLTTLALTLFCWNGLVIARGETPMILATSHPAKSAISTRPTQLKVMAYNIAKGFIYKGGVTFEKRGAMEARLQRLADVINAEQPDLLFLSEVVIECGPCLVNQAEWLAQSTDMHSWAFGEDFNFGLPFYRIVNGNAILSRRPLELVGNPSLAGRQPFYIMKNNRRVLLCAMEIADERVLLASIHTDSFDHQNNLRQTQQLLDIVGSQPAIMAGDFNATPESASIQLLKNSGRFGNTLDAGFTFPSDAPVRTIDYIFAPPSWRVLESHTVMSDASDHLAVVTTIEIP
jgi:endonuclease/exonuclease/phosphatase family metal-dependent hydrolase